MVELVVNGRRRVVRSDPDTPLLWVLRDELNLTGTKYGCGRGLCGACSVHLDRRCIRSCVTPVATIAGRNVTTIEGLAARPDHPVIRAWIAEQVPQCGYCQPGQIMAAAALLEEHPAPDEEEILRAMSGNLCRCGSYPRILRGVRRAAGLRNTTG